MKKQIFSILVITIVFGSIFISCAKENTEDELLTDSVELSFVLNGSGYSNQNFKFATSGAAVYEPQSSTTACTFSDASGNGAVLGFTGAKTGTFTVNDENSFMVTLDNGNTLVWLSTGTITVSKFGIVGNAVTGTFSGTGSVSKNSGDLMDITIKSGKFSAQRVY